MHIAAAVGTPVVALFGPTAAWRTGPYGDQHRVLHARLSCAPCFKRTCTTTACMQAIGVEDVLLNIEYLLNKTGNGSNAHEDTPLEG
jgi:ADP-heptose:LPS heptosyltransferase